MRWEPRQATAAGLAGFATFAGRVRRDGVQPAMRVRVASAGTGKTTSLVLRYLELIAAGVPLRRIAGVTYTRTAAGELRGRVRSALHELLETCDYLGQVRLEEADRPAFEEALRELDGATLTTIHGFMIDALRLSAPAMGLDPDFEIIAEWEAQALFEEEAASLLFLAADPAHPLHWAGKTAGGTARGMLLGLFERRSLVERFEADDDERSSALVELFEAAYPRFLGRLGARHMPPGEVERRALMLLGVPQAVRRLRSRVQVALIDEFQDVNPLQGRFFEALEGAGIDVEVVGDPKQSIYGFRDADVEVFRRTLEGGEELPPLDVSFRHGPIVNRFLNHLTSTLAGRSLGFSPREAPAVGAAGRNPEVHGRVEVHWVSGDEPIGDLREAEAQVLAARLEALHREDGVAYREMAVLARSHASLVEAERALATAGIPAVLLQGRGFFERIEIRDLYNALRAAVEPAGVPFAAWLRGPFAGLAPTELMEVTSHPQPLEVLTSVAPAVARRYRRLQELILRPPVEALKALIREPLIDGRSFMSFLDSRQRENVDALLFTVARQPPGELEVLLERLELLSRQRDAGDVPQTGEGVQLLTVHASKGLEWRAVALFDCGRRPPPRREGLRVEPGSGKVTLRGGPAFEAVGELLAKREEDESYRLLYVAASRPREYLILTGSVRGDRPEGWAKALTLLSLGPAERVRNLPELVLARHEVPKAVSVRASAAAPPAPPAAPAAPGAAGGAGVSDGHAVEVAPWIDRSFPAHPYPPVFSPSRLKSSTGRAAATRSRGRPAVVLPATDEVRGADGSDDGEPLRPGEVAESGELPGRSATVGTLVHYAISQSWSPSDPRQMANLRAQEVMFPYSPAEGDEILAEVGELLQNYWAMLGCELPALDGREADLAELPMAMPEGPVVWQGVIDRLYCAAGRWYLDDYKTDRSVEPDLYLPQLAIYAQCVRRVRGTMPVTRLVYLRSREVVEPERTRLEAAFEEVASQQS